MDDHLEGKELVSLKIKFNQPLKNIWTCFSWAEWFGNETENGQEREKEGRGRKVERDEKMEGEEKVEEDKKEDCQGSELSSKSLFA